MKMRATFERNYSLQAASTIDLDGFGQKLEDWREVGTWSCYAWAGKPREVLRDVGVVVTDTPGMIVPLGADVLQGDRVQKVTDRAGVQLFGAMAVSGRPVRRATHIELLLEAVS